MLADDLPHAWEFEAIGAPWRIDTAHPLLGAARASVSARIEAFDRDWSRFRSDSWVSRVAASPGRHELPSDGAPLLGLYRELYDATAGRVSPLVGRSMEALGYDASYRLAPGTPVPAPSWPSAVTIVDGALETASAVLLDVGAAGKGYLVDLVGEALTTSGVDAWFVDASGDLRARATSPRIALEHPADPSLAVGVAEPGERALCASAPNRRAWAGVHHILDAVTGLPAQRVAATWAVADSALVADGAATALFFDVDDEWLQRRRVEFVRLFSNGRVEMSPGFPGEVFTA